MEQLIDLYDELLEKSQLKYEKCNQQSKNILVEKIQQIRNDMNQLENDIETLIVGLDKDEIRLSKGEEMRLKDRQQRDRILDRVKPFLLLSQFCENI
jgi:hypothetical protein